MSTLSPLGTAEVRPGAWRRAVLTCVALTALCGLWLIPSSQADASWRQYKRKWPKLWIQKNPCSVHKVVDGDTVHVYCDGKKEKLRLVGIDTPETKHPFKPIEYFGPQASARAKGLMPKGSKVWLGFARRGARGKYGRLLAFIFLPGKGMFNALMVREGYAFAMRRYPNVYKQQFIALESKAKRARRGMWADMAKVRTMQAGDRQYRQHRKRCRRKVGGRFNWVIGDSSDKRYYTRRSGGRYFRTNPDTRVLFCTTQEAQAQGYQAATGGSRRYRRKRRYRRRRGGDDGDARVGRGRRGNLIIGDTDSQKFYVFRRGTYRVFRTIREAKDAGFRRVRKRKKRRRKKRRRTRRRRRKSNGGSSGSAKAPDCGGKTPIVSNRRSKKYRVPSMRSYRRATRSKNAVYFCTEQEAINAGHVRAKR